MHQHVFRIVCLLVLISVGLSSAGAAVPDCDELEGNANGILLSLNEFLGQADLSIGGQLRSATVTTTLVDLRLTEDGTIQATSTHVYELDGSPDGSCDLGENCFETTDHTVVDLTNNLALNEVNRISNGHGEFAEACGKFTSHGSISLTTLPPTVSWRLKGRICTCN